MNDRTTELQRLLCEQWCAAADVVEDAGGMRLSLPIHEADGDTLTVWLQQELGGWHIRDHGTTLMRLSYEIDVDLLKEGQRAKVVDRILTEQSLSLEDGELSVHAKEGDLGTALMQFGHAMTRLGDLKLWTWPRVSSTFYEDLQRELERIAGSALVKRNYVVPDVPDASNYPVDFAIETHALPFYVFGVPHTDKARLATIILLHLQKAGHLFNSLVVPADLDSIPKADRNRLLNAANDVVTGLDAVEPLERKVKLRLAG